jgi:hypothetical protein
MFFTSLLSLVLVCSVVFVILSGFSLLICDLPLECPLRAVIRGHPTLGGFIAMMGNSDIFRYWGVCSRRTDFTLQGW